MGIVRPDRWTIELHEGGADRYCELDSTADLPVGYVLRDGDGREWRIERVSPETHTAIAVPHQ